MKITTKFVFLIILTSSIYNLIDPLYAELFSSTNRFGLSINYADNFGSSSGKKFYSLPGLYTNDNTCHFLQMLFNNESLAIGAGSIIAVESAQSESAPYGVVFGDAQFKSPYLDSKVRLNIYTMKNVQHASPIDIEYERLESGKMAPISGMFDMDFSLPEAYLTFKYRSLNLTIGKEKVRWGPGYKGTLALSGTSLAPFYYYHLKLNLLDRVRLSCFLVGLDDDKLYKKEFTGFDTLKAKTKTTSIVTLPPRYGVGQRIDIIINDHLQFGIHELCDFYGANDLTRYANPLQIYYLGFNSGTNEANMMAGCDINLLFKPFRFYGEFLDDDITIFDNKGNPNKYAFQLGGVYYRNKTIQEIGVEYTHVSKYTYGHYSILNRHEYWGEPEAWPWGNDQDLLNLHVILKPHNNMFIKFETNYWLKGKGTLKDEWLVDGRPDLDNVPYWPQNPKKILSFVAGCEYFPFSWLTTTFNWQPSFVNEKMYNDLFGYLILNIPNLKKDIVPKLVAN